MAESLHILLGTSACLQWLCHSGERNVACGPLVIFTFIFWFGIHSWTFGFVWLNKMAVVLPEVSKMQV